MKIKITKGGIYGEKGEIAVGTELDVPDTADLKGWAGRYEVVSSGKGKEAVLNENNDKKYLAKHKAAGVWVVLEGETELRTGLDKAKGDAFNALDAAGQDAWLVANPAA